MLEQLVKTILLGVVQGLTEWLPISSTGHLKVCERLLGLSVPLLFDVALHVGTLLVVLAFFRKDVKAVLGAVASLNFKTGHGRLIPLIIVGTVPTAVIGWLLSELCGYVFQNLSIIALAFIICGFILYLARTEGGGSGTIRFREALLIGVAQGFAVVPGLSRSGLTISIALLLGIKREEAFRFSFLLSVPAVVSASALTLHREFNVLIASSLGFVDVAAGTMVALVVGYSALKLLWRVLAKGKFYLFAFYCWVFGALLLSAMFLGFF
ncbi:MAG: undecaprenyl-diphosphate phosphatase [Candidatus Bathyarchaeia archaeon]